MSRRTAPRVGFTLIELLVVISIIAILVSLTAAGVMRVRRTANRTVAIAEIAQISNGIGAFKAKLNVHIPAFGGGANGAFRLCSSYHDAAGNWLNWPEVIYLKQVFPGMESVQVGGNWDNGLRAGPGGVAIPNNNPVLLDPNQTLFFFLTGGGFTNYQGFSTNRNQPFETTATSRIGPFYEVKQDKLDATTLANGGPHYLDPFGSPYAYFAYDPALNAYPQLVWPAAGVGPLAEGGRLLNAKSFQILSAGQNKTFGYAPIPVVSWPVNWTPGVSVWGDGQAGGDDLSNFNAGPLLSNGK